MREKLPYPEDVAKGYPSGRKRDYRRVLKCSEPDVWYKNKVGEIITVHYFVSFGAWDTKGRWLWYYDLSAPITVKQVIWEEINIFFKKLFGK